MRLLTCAALAAAIAIVTDITPRARADAPRVYAIRGARIITAAGAPIADGTVVIRGGVIEAVGSGIAAPSDALVIEGAGLTVYPGLIDLGNTRAADQPAPPLPQNARTTAELERWKRGQILKPQSRAADAVKVDDAEMTKLAAAGITSVLALPSGEVISGQSALVNVAAPPDEPQIGNIVEPRRGLVVVRTPVALHVSFPERPRGNAYPQSLMGVIAFVRQSFLDAQHFAAVRGEGAPASARGGTNRAPAWQAGADDPALEAMLPAIDRKMPVAFEANEAREILRVLRMSRELKLDPIVTGGREASEVATDLKALNARVIYSLNYPQRPKTLAPDADETISALRARADAPKHPAELARAGVPFAFESAGLSDPKEFVRNAAKAVKAGLPDEAAIRALTIGAATLAGAGDRLGSIERGKIANVILTDGDIFDEKTAVKRVFIEGRPVSLEPPAAPSSGRGRGGR